ncbi:MAG TPA: hypothetical protein VFS05_09180 [Gemmatimonadaceae bacterium]|nr:hypothetical protein [Gemmatimonadaceae bacterium]
MHMWRAPSPAHPTRPVLRALSIVLPLVLAGGCGGDAPPTGTEAAGTLRVTVSTTGAQVDADGYTVTPAGLAAKQVGATGEVTFERIIPKSYEVTLGGIAANCAVLGINPQTVTVPARGSATATYQVSCSALAGRQRIAFVSDRDGNREIYVMELDGSGQTRLTNFDGLDSDPSWSPDASKIAFTRFVGGTEQVAVMSANGSGVTLFPLDGATAMRYPVWSPDGTRIVYTAVNGSGSENVWVMNADGSNRRQVTNLAGFALRPSWGPNGATILYDFDGDIYEVNTDGSGTRPVMATDAVERNASYSPDGTRILFHRQVTDTNIDIFVMNADGSNVHKIGDFSIEDADASWSPDGTRILFASRSAGNTELYVMNADGTNVVRLTYTLGANEGDPTWSR